MNVSAGLVLPVPAPGLDAYVLPWSFLATAIQLAKREEA